MLPLLYVALFMQLGTTLPASPAETHRQEVALLHRLVAPESLRSLDVWDGKIAEWRKARPNEVADSAEPVLLLHFFASWCKPCRAEFPVWREMGPQLGALYKGKVRILYVAIQTNNVDMEKFLGENKANMPDSPWFLDVGERLAATVRKGLAGDQLPLPVTLWLDKQRVVRQALAGPISARRSEVADSTARLVRLMDQLGAQSRAPNHP